MSSYILDRGTAKNRASYVADHYGSGYELLHLAAEKTTIKIEQIHALAAQITTRSSLPRVVWVEEASQMTTPAQNALLKTLEEPGENTTYLLTCEAASLLLPTIRSRCVSIHLSNKSDRSNSSNLIIIKQAMSASPGDRLVIAGNLGTDRTEALVWIRSLARELSASLHVTTSAKSQQLLGRIEAEALAAERELFANCSVSLVLQHFFLHLPRVR